MRARVGFLALALFVGMIIAVQGASSKSEPIIPRLIAAGKLKPATIHLKDGGTKVLPFFSGGVVSTIEQASQGIARSNAARRSAVPGGAVDSLGCSDRARGRDVRVNQDCTFRRQAETNIAYNPRDPRNLVGGMNDSIIGWNQTSLDFSLDGGHHWGAISTAPFRFRLNAPETLFKTADDPNRHTITGTPGTLHSYDACSDPFVAFDSQGRAFYTCVAFDLASNAGLVFVVPSQTGAKGSTFDQVYAPFDLTPPATGREHIVMEDNSPAASPDGPKVAADSYPNSPNRDNVYSSFTRFNFTCGPNSDQYCYSKIYASMSTDHGFTWSTPIEVNGANKNLCVLGNHFDPSQTPGDCNMNGHSDMAVMPNGDLVITYQNGNTPDENQQIMTVLCQPSGSSTQGTAKLNCGRPHRVSAQIFAGAPRCDFADTCSPGAYIRTPEETSQRVAVNQKNGTLYDTWYDYRNGEWDIFISRSTNQGHDWSKPRQVNTDVGLDHYFSAVDVDEQTGRVAVTYARTGRVPNENTTPSGGFAVGMPGVQDRQSDYVLAWAHGNLKGRFKFRVLSPKTPPPDGNQAGFNGDYNDIVVTPDGRAHPTWSDTRVRVPDPGFYGSSVDEDMYTTSKSIR
ncbi:MAG: hypothetical protein ACJ738_04010 [Gaiellales bacterium]